MTVTTATRAIPLHRLSDKASVAVVSQDGAIVWPVQQQRGGRQLADLFDLDDGEVGKLIEDAADPRVLSVTRALLYVPGDDTGRTVESHLTLVSLPTRVSDVGSPTRPLLCAATVIVLSEAESTRWNLGRREVEFLKLIANGWGIAEAGQHMGVGRETANRICSRVRKKFNAKSLAQVMAIAGSSILDD